MLLKEQEKSTCPGETKRVYDDRLIDLLLQLPAVMGDVTLLLLQALSTSSFPLTGTCSVWYSVCQIRKQICLATSSFGVQKCSMFKKCSEA